MDLYNRILENPCMNINNRTFIFAGKKLHQGIY